MMNKGDLSNAQENLANERLFMIIFVIMIFHYNYNTFIGLVSKKDQVKYSDSYFTLHLLMASFSS